MIRTLKVPLEKEGIRIDVFLTEELENLSRSYVQKLLKSQAVQVNGHVVKANYKVEGSDSV